MFHRRLPLNRNQGLKVSRLRYAVKTYRQYQVAVKLPGSFRLAAGNRHLHRYCIFTERVSETVAQTLHYSTRRNLPDTLCYFNIPLRQIDGNRFDRTHTLYVWRFGASQTLHVAMQFRPYHAASEAASAYGR